MNPQGPLALDKDQRFWLHIPSIWERPEVGPTCLQNICDLAEEMAPFLCSANHLQRVDKDHYETFTYNGEECIRLYVGGRKGEFHRSLSQRELRLLDKNLRSLR